MRALLRRGVVALAAVAGALAGARGAAAAPPDGPARADPVAAARPDDLPRPPCPPCPSCADVAPRLRVQATATTTWALAAGLDDDRGDLTVGRAGVDVLVAWDATPRVTVGLDVGVEEARYDLSRPDLVVPGPGRLLETATTAYVTPGVRVRPDDLWTLSAAVTVATGFAPGAAPEDGVTSSVVVTARRRVSAALALTAGVLVSTALEDDPTVVPIVWLSGASPTAGPVRFEFRGAGLRASYDVSDRLALAVSARYVRRDVRLADDDRLPGGVARDVRVPVSVEVDVRPTPDLVVTAAVGLHAYAALRFLDRDGHEVADAQADVGAWFGLAVTLRF